MSGAVKGKHRTPVGDRKYEARHRSRRKSYPHPSASAGAAVVLAVVAMTSGTPLAQARLLPAAGSPRADITTTIARPAHHAAATGYTVRSGDSLSAIAGRVYHNPALWPALWWINKAAIANPNNVEAGQHLKLSSWHPLTAWLAAAAMRAVPAPLPPPRPMAVTASRPGSGSGYQAPARTYQSAGSSGGSYSGGSPGGAFGACVVARESGGNAQVMNSSGHYGLYQFSSSTWQAYGGSASSFGHASVGEQQQVFSNALAQGGQSNWSPYDGC